jgi:hypothetical protein
MNDLGSEMVAAAGEPDLLAGVAFLVNELDRLRPVIEKALPYTHRTHELNDLVAMVVKGEVRLWTTEHSFMLIERTVYPRRVHYHIFLAGGDLDELRGLHPEVIAAARADGAQALTLTGRRGWVRALVDWGWEEVYTTVMLDIGEAG